MKTYVNPDLQKLFNRAETFCDWSEAFDTCRERNHPIIARVDSKKHGSNRVEICKIFPSGQGQVLF
jgi:hypothetical protein